MNPNVDKTPENKGEGLTDTSVDTTPNPDVVAPEAPTTSEAIPVNDSTTSTQDNEPRTPDTPTAPMDAPVEQPLAAAPVTQTKKHHKVRILILIVLIVGILAAAGYYTYVTYFTSEPAPSNNTETTQTVDTPVEVDEEISAIENGLDGLDDSELDETTLSDESLTE